MQVGMRQKLLSTRVVCLVLVLSLSRLQLQRLHGSWCGAVGSPVYPVEVDRSVTGASGLNSSRGTGSVVD